MKFAAILGALLLAGCQTVAGTERTDGLSIDAGLRERHDFSLADTPNKRTSLAYLYTAWNEGRLREARLTYWRRGSFPELEAGGAPSGPPGPSPRYTVHRIVEEGDLVVVQAFVQGVGVGQPFTTVFGTPGGIKIGDAVVEIFRFDERGLIAEKWDTIEPVSEATYDFR
ncbi:MAG: hypothetical protein V4647_07130 [Pseudomonadota bacterium]